MGNGEKETGSRSSNQRQLAVKGIITYTLFVINT